MFRKNQGNKKPIDPAKLTDEKAFSYAVWLLGRQMYTAELLKDKIKLKGYSRKQAEAAVGKLVEMKYVDDAQYADVMSRNFKEFKPYGFYGIKQRLMRKKIPNEEIERVMGDFTEKDERRIAARFVKQHAGEASDKLTRMLQNRGFRWPAISSALRKIRKAVPASPDTTNED